MSSTKKIVLFIVEGITEKVALGSILKKIFKDEKIDFQITQCDITSDRDNSTANIINVLNGYIDKYMMQYHYKISDFKAFIHIIDTDGAFVSNDCIINHDSEKVIYTAENIKTKNVENMKKRNERKSKIINMLSTTSEIRKKSYKLYYFSSNLDHVLFNEQNLLKDQKTERADEFNDRYIDDIERIC